MHLPPQRRRRAGRHPGAAGPGRRLAVRVKEDRLLQEEVPQRHMSSFYWWRHTRILDSREDPVTPSDSDIIDLQAVLRVHRQWTAVRGWQATV